MDQERVKELVGKFKEQKVVVVGDVCLDQYIEGAVERLNPEAPVPILLAKRVRVMTGCGGNTAKNAASLGATCWLASVVGRDEEAQQLREQAQQEGYRAYVVEDVSRPTPRKVRHLVGSQQLLRVDYEETHEVSEEMATALLAHVRTAINDGARAILVSDYAKGVLTTHVAQELLELAREKNVLLVADVKPSHAALMRGAKAMTPNLKEAHEFVGINYLEQKLPASAVARKVHEKLATDAYVTLGAQGVYVLTDEVDAQVPQEHVVEVFDVSGAGDTFAATLLLALLAGATPVEAARLANAAGAVAVSKVGSVGVTQAELLNMVVAHEQGRTPRA